MRILKMRLYRLLTSRVVIIGFNFMIAYFAWWVLCQIGMDARTGSLNLAELDRTTEGMAVLIVAYGVTLESRKDLREILGLIPHHDSPTEQRIDQVCHDFGIILLLFGLFTEIPNQAVKVPDHIFNTAGRELWTLLACAPFILGALVASLLATWRLLRLPKLREMP